MSKTYISKSSIPHSGRGVFASFNIPKGSIIEKCICINRGNYLYLCDEDRRIVFQSSWGCLVALGHGSFYQHRVNPNAKWVVNNQSEITFQSKKDIAKNEEIFIDYWDACGDRVLEEGWEEGWEDGISILISKIE